MLRLALQCQPDGGACTPAVVCPFPVILEGSFNFHYRVGRLSGTCVVVGKDFASTFEIPPDKRNLVLGQCLLCAASYQCKLSMSDCCSC